MENRFFEKPILNSPYAYPVEHWDLDNEGQPTQRTIKGRRRAEFITPIPKPRKRMKIYWVPGVNHLGTYGHWALPSLLRSIRSKLTSKPKSKPNSTS